MARPADGEAVARRGVAVLGSTGSVGTQALEVIDALRDELEVATLAAGSNVDLLARQARRFRPALVAVADREAAGRLREELEDLDGTEVAAGPGAIEAAAVHESADIVLAAIVGAAGLPAVLAAARAGRDIALANKESLVVAGALLVEAARRSGARLLPVDSEHCAIHQCLRGGAPEEVDRLVLTASGGPFRDHDPADLEEVRPREALVHPNWDMGDKITIDSATLMNKGLEVIEARWLFGVPPERIDVVIHPQSLVHSLVGFRDGSWLAQVSATDMRLPIQYALTWPRREAAVGPRVDPRHWGRLEFREPDSQRFPCLALAYRALELGGGATAVLNAANEVAVEAFLAEEIPFPGIAETVGAVLEELGRAGDPAELDELLEVDARAREAARRRVAGS